MFTNNWSTWRGTLSPSGSLPPSRAPRHLFEMSVKEGVTMITLEARCRSGHYIAAVVPIIDKHLDTEYRVFVFHHGHEVYAETEWSLNSAMDTATAYLNWQRDQDLDS